MIGEKDIVLFANLICSPCIHNTWVPHYVAPSPTNANTVVMLVSAVGGVRGGTIDSG